MSCIELLPSDLEIVLWTTLVSLALSYWDVMPFFSQITWEPSHSGWETISVFLQATSWTSQLRRISWDQIVLLSLGKILTHHFAQITHSDGLFWPLPFLGKVIYVPFCHQSHCFGNYIFAFWQLCICLIITKFGWKSHSLGPMLWRPNTMASLNVPAQPKLLAVKNSMCYHLFTLLSATYTIHHGCKVPWWYHFLLRLLTTGANFLL